MRKVKGFSSVGESEGLERSDLLKEEYGDQRFIDRKETFRNGRRYGNFESPRSIPVDGKRQKVPCEINEDRDNQSFNTSDNMGVRHTTLSRSNATLTEHDRVFSDDNLKVFTTLR